MVRNRSALIEVRHIISSRYPVRMGLCNNKWSLNDITLNLEATV